MRKAVSLTICMVFIWTLLSPAVLADSHRFELLKAGVINGVKLKPGEYILEFDGSGQGKIRRGSKLLLETEVEVHPIGSAMPDSVSQFRDGRVKEIRLKQERVVFIGTGASAQTAQ